MDVVDTLTKPNPASTIGFILENGMCSAVELEKFGNWILPEMEKLMQVKCSGFTVFNLFKAGK